MKQCFAVALLLMLFFVRSASGQSLEDQYVRIYNLIQEGDTLNNNGQYSQALTKYTQAQNDLDVFQKGNPDWNVQIVSFRLNYLANQIATLNPKAPPPAAAQSNVVQKAPQPLQTEEPQNKPSVPPDWEQQLNSLKDRVSQLQNQLGQAQGDKSLLEAKLKEAFAAQPQGVDPRELEKTQTQLKSLQKENDLLKVTLDKEKAKPRQADAKSLADAQKALAEANRQLALQTDKANSLASEKSFLQHKLSLLSTDSANSTALESTRKALADANRQIIDQKSLSARLAAEKQTLQARLDAMSAANHNPTQESVSELAALRDENALLKKQLASAKEMPASSGGDLARELTETRAQLAALQSDKELWRLEKVALENRVRQLQATALPHALELASAPAAAAPVAAPVTARDTKAANRIRQLEQERDELRKRLEAANRELYGKKNQAGASKVEELENQLASLQARLDAFEARQVPYTTEELALFKRPQPKLASADVQAQPAHQSIEQLSPTTARLIVEARGYFSSAEYDKAEAAYLEAAHQDDKNVPILANLAAIQIERGRFDSAETNVHKALTLMPNDPYSLFVLGNLKFRQGKYDEALEALSRAAKLDPSNAEVQNYLGLTLSEKGMRVPAETALRKAIDLDPNYGSAHNNLAVIYLTQQPPALELARFHYEKALAAGAPHNPELEKMLEHKEGGEKRASE